jgi:hypothetical protein
MKRTFPFLLVLSLHPVTSNAQQENEFKSFFYFNEFKIESDPEYLIVYEKIYGEPAFDPIWRRSAVGILAGYKWLVREQLVLEPLFGIGYNFLPVFDHRRRSDVLPFINVNIGYRF